MKIPRIQTVAQMSHPLPGHVPSVTVTYGQLKNYGWHFQQVLITRFNDTFYYFWYKREVGNWAVVREFIFVQGRFLEERWYDRFFESVVKVTRAKWQMKGFTQGHWKWHHLIDHIFAFRFRCNYGCILYHFFWNKVRLVEKCQFFILPFSFNLCDHLERLWIFSQNFTTNCRAQVWKYFRKVEPSG